MRKADNLPPYRAVVMKSESLNFLEPSGPAQACYGRALPFTFKVLHHALHIIATALQGVKLLLVAVKSKLKNSYRDLITTDFPFCSIVS